MPGRTQKEGARARWESLHALSGTRPVTERKRMHGPNGLLLGARPAFLNSPRFVSQNPPLFLWFLCCPPIPLALVQHCTHAQCAMAGLAMLDQKNVIAVTIIIVTAFKICISHRKNGLLNREYTQVRF